MTAFLPFSNDSRIVLDAFSRSLAIISFTPDGTILDANENFCEAIGYERREIIGKHHRIFVEQKEALSAEYGNPPILNGAPQ